MTNVIWSNCVGMTNLYLADRTPNTILTTCRLLRPQLIIVVPLVGNSLVKALEKQLKREPSSRRTLFRLLCRWSLLMQKISPDSALDRAESKWFRSINEKLLGTDVRAIIFGGSHTPRETLRTLNALGYYSVTGFGMTETAITGVETSLRLKYRLNGSVGQALPSVEYRIAPDGDSRSRGELQIRGSSIHSGQVIHGEILPPDTVEGG